MRARPLLACLAVHALVACGTGAAPDAARDVPSWPDARDASSSLDAPAPPDDAPSSLDAPDAPAPPDAAPDGPHCAGTLSPDGGCAIEHAFDLAAYMPARLAVMYSMSWFGIPTTGDPDGPGTDASYGNWRWGGGCVATNDPRTCTAVGPGPQRVIASNRRPLAGIYSSSARDDASRRRVDLMLSALRRPCDDGARLDAWSVQLDSVRFSSRYVAEGSAQYAASADYAYRALVAFLERADAGAMRGVVLPGIDSTWYWHFGDARGVSTQAARLGALEDDLVDMVQLAAAHPSAVRVGGRLLVYAYTGGDAAGPYLGVDEWLEVLRGARDRTGEDFYAIGATTDAGYFRAFDAIAPWIQNDVWAASAGATVRARATDWTQRRHAAVVAALPAYPGRVVFGGLSPGFDDYTRDWGACQDRAVPRDPDLLPGQLDYFAQARAAGTDVRGFVLETWDDWTEGSEFEPDVVGGTETLVQLRQLLGAYYGEPADGAGDARLDARWRSYGQARDCASGSQGPGPTIELRCP